MASAGESATPDALPSASASSSAPQQDFLVQYVVVRKDLWGSLGWPLGSVVAQACHASSAAMWLHREDEATQRYLAPDNIDHMRKVVLEVKDEAQLRKLSAQLTQGGIGHKMWVEQPEDFPTCLATKPCAKSEVASYFKKFQLSKAPIG
ncbi:putative peptidyl-tRNA hydrolase PTRHD1 [Tetrabaena socialis]|uniref:peptidyl-tRNA hydrolase n=1 Tax=Tetrabaena socialis TaxID=47790 RepID=A0A2J8AKA1_9CHLO|nr:putative peptidyl-tRNA hydrolase PTRHD1 [Tetrabaena socialis]|eukprot:PNH12939.1 putative peptidyl-tRNA hydrolase PTRHD1 [Tetrabaena socialis]